MVVELQGFRITSGIEFAKTACADEFSGEKDGKTEDFVEPRREKGIGVIGFASEPA